MPPKAKTKGDKEGGKGERRTASPEKGKQAKETESPGREKSRKGKGSPSKESGESKTVETRNKVASTREDIPPHLCTNFRCDDCGIVYHDFLAFIAHSCWRKYFLANRHLANTQAHGCPNCLRVFGSLQDYGAHRCGRPEPEHVLPLSLQHHLHFFKAWRRRVERETEPHAPDTAYLLRCATCGGRFKQRLAFLVHSCIAAHGLATANVNRLTFCRRCRLVFGSGRQFAEHVAAVCDRERAEELRLECSRVELACQQFVLLRHRAEGRLPDSTAPPSTDCPNVCFECGGEFPSLLAHLCHPCAAGKAIRPLDLELTLLCRQCHRFFTDIGACQRHLRSCPATGFYFLRLTAAELGLALERHSEDELANVHRDPRPPKLLCGACHELFRRLEPFLRHACPSATGRRRRLLQPSGLAELFACAACHLVCLGALEAQGHTCSCPLAGVPRLVRLHLTKTEYVAALEPWCRKPRVLEMPLSLSIEPAEDQ